MTLGTFLAVCWVSSALCQQARLVLNEAMANEPEGATSREWVEVLNWPDSGDGAINLAGYRFVDGNDTTLFDTNLTIPPGGFIVLARKPVCESSVEQCFEEYWGDGSGVWGDSEEESYPVVKTDMGLRNGTDTVTIISPTGDTSSILWTSSSDDGVSIERIRPDSHDDVSSFADCLDAERSTPGRENSVLPGENDIAVDSIVVSAAEPLWREEIYFTIHFTNVGFGPAAGYEIRLYEDLNPFAPETVFELIGEVILEPEGPIPEGARAIMTIKWTDAPPGAHLFFTEVEFDPNPANNRQRGSVTVRHSQPLLIISEFLANPLPGGPDEWVEICNQADFSVNMRSVGVGDSSRQSGIPPYAGSMDPGRYWVLAENEAAFVSFYPDFSGMLIEIPGWQSLNNTGDRIRLLGAADEIIDSLTFEKLYPDNRSVERLSLSPTFAAPEDWAGSVDPSGATPGRANSVNRETAGTFQVWVSPNPFYLSRMEWIEIEYRMEIGERLTLKIFDRSGRLVKTIADEAPAASGKVEWNGTDDGGGRVRPGPYVLLARSDPHGEVVKKVIVVGP